MTGGAGDGATLRGEATAAARRDLDAAGPALAAVRYADPAAWTVAAAVARAVAPRRDAILAEHERVGVVVVSPDGPVEAAAAVRAAARAGAAAPLRFPAAGPGSLVGVVCLGLGLRGPSLVLTVPPARGAPIGLRLANGWLARGHAAWVVLVACIHTDGLPRARALAIASGAHISAADLAWLVALAEEVG